MAFTFGLSFDTGLWTTSFFTDSAAADTADTARPPRCLADMTLLSTLYMEAESDISSPASIADPKNASQL